MLPDAYPKIAEKYKPGPNSPIPTHIGESKKPHGPLTQPHAHQDS